MKPIIKLSWHQCELIANYYSFPTVSLLLNEKDMIQQFEGKKREAELTKRLRKQLLVKLAKEVYEDD